jgi:hypothetical protein
MRTAQELFDTIVAGLRSQKARSVMAPLGDEEEACAYRGVEGRKCALGWVIPDEDYTPALEGQTLGGLLQNNMLPDELAQEFEVNRHLLIILQSIHDHDPIDTWEHSFQRIAGIEGLNYTSLSP